MSTRPSLSASAAASPRPFSVTPWPSAATALPNRSGARRSGKAGEHAHRLRILRQARHRESRPRTSTRSSLPLFARSTIESPQPAKFVPSAGHERRARARERRRTRLRHANVRRRRLVTGVGHEQVVPPVAVVVGRRDAHPGIPVGDALGGRALLEAEAEPGRVGLHAAGPRDVLVQLVRILVVGDVEVGPPVAVVVREHRSEAVAEVRRLETRSDADLAEPRAAVRAGALVQIEEVAHAGVVRREAGGRSRDRVVEIRVAGHEHVGAAVAVHVRDGRAGVPAGRRSCRRRALPR